MSKRLNSLVGILLTVLCLLAGVQAQSRNPVAGGPEHILYGDLKVGGKGADGQEKSAYRIVLKAVSGIVVGRRTVSNGGRYRFLSVPNGDYVLTIEMGDREVARMNRLVNEMRATDIRRDLEFEWSDSLGKRAQESSQTVYARPAQQEKLFSEAQAAQSEGDLARADELLEKLISGDKKDFEAWIELGSVRFRMNQPGPAENAYRKALELRPDLILGHHNLGKLLFQQKQYDDSIAELEQVVGAVPEFAEAHMLLGEAYLQVKKGSKAVPHLEKAIELEPLEMADAHMRLATLYRAAGYTDLAVEHFRQYIEKRPDTPGKKQIEKYIKENSSRN